MEAIGVIFLILVVLGINFAQGYTAQKAQNEKFSRKDEERKATVLGSKSLTVAESGHGVEDARVDLKKVAVGMTLLELGLDPKRRDHWSTAEQVVEAQLEALDAFELTDRGPLMVSDLDTDPVIELPSRDPIEVSLADDVATYQPDLIPAE